MFDQIQLPPEIEESLSALKARIRRYVFWEGLALVVLLIGGFFWVSLGFDCAVFAIRRLEPPRGLRMFLDVAVLGAVAAVVLIWIVFRVFRSFGTKALALVLERRFPELNDRLVTAVEMGSQGPDASSALTSAMLQRTVVEAAEKLKQVDVDSVFDRRPLRRALTAAAVCVVTIGSLALMNQEVFGRWADGYIGLKAEYWPRDVGLVATVLAQPGDRVKSFSADGVYKHPRGSDLVLLFDVPRGKKVPERVELQYRLSGGRGYGRATCFAAGERRFKHAIDDLLDDAEFWVTAGDFTNREAYRVQVVEPPRVDSLVAECFFPEHTKRVTVDDATGKPVREAIAVQGTQISMPIETEFLLRANANKPLVRARLQFGSHELTLSPTDGTFVSRSADGNPIANETIPAEQLARLFDTERREFVIPFVLSELATPAARERHEKLGKPFVMPPDAVLRIFLEDSDDIIGAEPARITVHGIADTPPSIASELRGIGTSVTRKAEIPVAGVIADDYGLRDVRFEFQIDDKEPWESRPMSKSPAAEPREFKLEASESDPTERFEILKMDLAVGQKLTLTVVAEDADNLNGPHVSRSQKFSFKIVSNEELLSLLYQRELNLRRRFEQIISEVKQTRGDLILHRAKADNAAKGTAGAKTTSSNPKRLRRRTDEAIEAQSGESPWAGMSPTLRAEPQTRSSSRDAVALAGASGYVVLNQDPPKPAELLTAVTASVIRSLHAVRKNATETTSVEEAFRDIRAELINNAVHTPQMLERIDSKIVQPLHSLNTDDYPDVDELLGGLKVLLDDGGNPVGGLDESIERLGRMLDRMDSILKEMQRLETFQEAVELLKSIIDQQQQLEEKTKSERKKRRIQELKGLSDE